MANGVFSWLSEGWCVEYYNKETIIKGLKRCITRRSKTSLIECAENASHQCREQTVIKGIKPDASAEIAYIMGWREVDYTGVESIACEECINYIKDHLDEWEEFRTREFKQ